MLFEGFARHPLDFDRLGLAAVGDLEWFQQGL
jgi:hypothetical protein